MTQITAKIIADSLHPNGIDRITTIMVTFPRYILAELNTHRMFSRNSASSRAIPFKKMVQSIKENPFIPIAWQKDHSGMQGTDYFTDKGQIEHNINYWLLGLTKSIKAAEELNTSGVTKQLCNRLLEPFMWHTVLITSTEWENFFNLRCPNYIFHDDECKYDQHNEEGEYHFKSKKDAIKFFDADEEIELNSGTVLLKNLSDIEWLKLNYGQADIHMMALAEAMWDAKNESIPKQLEEDQWHIPFGDQIDYIDICKDIDKKLFDQLLVEGMARYNPKEIEEKVIKIATARCARISYTVVGEEEKITDYQKDIELHDRLIKSGHYSPLEHCAKVMNEEEYNSYSKCYPNYREFTNHKEFMGQDEEFGWCRNYKGFIQYRELID